jgi:V-type H+-transporting ATPase subunit B
MPPAIPRPGMTALEAAAINAAAVTRNFAVKPRLQYQTVSAVSGVSLVDCLIPGPLIILDNVKVGSHPGLLMSSFPGSARL